MRVVIDMQGAQSLGSRNRGIGRYTLSIAKALVRNRGDHEIVLALNGSFSDSIEAIRESFAGLLPAQNIRVWHVAVPIAHQDATSAWRRNAAELTYEAFLLGLKPDFIYITSLFEGLGDDAVTSIHRLQDSVPVAVTLYDLIPYIKSSPYLDNPIVRDWYMEKVEHLRRADLWLAISASSRQEGIDHLALPHTWSVNISTDADAWFQPVVVAPEDERGLRTKYGLTGPFVLYTGGIDHRKNVEGLIRAYAKLAPALRQSYQLAIVCSIQPGARAELQGLIQRHGLDEASVILTGFVSDEELLQFYNLCKLFIFPSRHEGFGLPALEAMRCGAPVIGSNTSSLPEVIGWEQALFDPESDESIAACMTRALTDDAYRAELLARAQTHARQFSWDESGRRAMHAMELRQADWISRRSMTASSGRKPRLAYVSPLPPARSGIADYSAELLPALAQFYEIDVVVDPDDVRDASVTQFPVRTPEWLLEHADEYDRVLYHFGNSLFHRYMFPLLDVVPGVVVLHDFFLSGVIAALDLHGLQPGSWSRALYAAHGYAGVSARHRQADITEAVGRYPCSLGVVQKSLGLIVHSANSQRLAKQWYGEGVADWVEVPHMRDSHIDLNKSAARRALGLKPDDFVVCTFGFLNATKLNHRLIDAWAESTLATDASCHLVFVGENPDTEYGRNILEKIRRLGTGAHVSITGWADVPLYRCYLAAADVGVQLRALSRGETSGTVLDCMNYGMATIVNANGSMADLNPDTVWLLADEFENSALTEALEKLRSNRDLRDAKGAEARRIILERHAPDVCARQYRDAIEGFFERSGAHPAVLARAIAREAGQARRDDIRHVSMAVARSLQPRNRLRQIFVDISEVAPKGARRRLPEAVGGMLRNWLEVAPDGFRVEPVYAVDDGSYRYARQFAMGILSFKDEWLSDEAIDFGIGDVMIRLTAGAHPPKVQQQGMAWLRTLGIPVRFMICALPDEVRGREAASTVASVKHWLERVGDSDSAFCISSDIAEELSGWIRRHALDVPEPVSEDFSGLGGARKLLDRLLH